MTRIVVGVDGSEHSRRALRRGMEEAALRDGTVDAVYVYEPPRRSISDSLISLPGPGDAMIAGSISPDPPAHHPPSREEQALAEAERWLEQFIDETIDGMAGPKPQAVPIPADHAAEGLINESGTADLLVIGTRGHGGFAGMVLGSVAHQCIQSCRVPMLILPPAE